MEKNYQIDATLSDVVNKKCPILCAMEVIGSKWKLPIIWYLHEKEKDGLILRRELISAPPKVVEYSLTDFGKELIPALNELYIWGEKILKKSV